MKSTEKTIAILQSNYIPWKGYFDLIRQVDEFVLYDEVQYTKNDWRNRNQIKTPGGLHWLTIPVQYSGKFGQNIAEIRVAHQHWRKKHFLTIEQNYRKSPYFSSYKDQLASIYQGEEVHLSQINYRFIEWICQLWAIKTPLRCSSEFPSQGGDRNLRLIEICQQAGAQNYLSGPSAQSYIDETLFSSKGISIKWMDYSHYPPYPQLHGPFAHHVSALDLLFNVGAQNALQYLRPVT